jgi:hypothetical protein
MKVTYKLLIPALLAGFLLGGCADKDAGMPAEEAMDAAGEMASDAVDEAGEMASDTVEAAAEAVSGEPGGYVPTDDERVPGETR